ncbi:hypothetical protein [Aquaticitalea lipolytica]|uniref:hypothetical protein n=1 Tax=Aquaticitalea lipolytica TaxID=1247562 RepID=UPI0024BBBB9E|nr:hypothetical protein [Aquaticitalea lipolytica]
MKKYYFFVVSIILLVLSFIGFSDNLITDVGQESNSDPKFIIHGLFCFAWFIILVIQTNFIKKGNYKAHMTYGIAGLLAALGVFITTLYIFIVIYKGWDNMRPDVKANRLFMLSFAVLVTQAYLKRKKLATHKRLMFVATFYMLGPILGRVMGHSILNTLLVSDLSWDITFIGIWSLFFVSLLMYDWAILKKIHPVSYLGVLGFCVIWMISFLT